MAYTFTRTGAQIEEIHNTVDDLPNIVSNGNLIANASFDIAGSVTNPPDATPRSYSAGDELFLGFKAVGALSGVTYINGKLNGTGQLYVDIYKTEKQKLSTAPYVASIASSDGVSVESGASFVDNGDYWRVTFDMNDTFSVKLEQGNVATGHETMCGIANLTGRYTYQSGSVDDMKKGKTTEGKVSITSEILDSYDVTVSTQGYYGSWASMASPQGAATYTLTSVKRVRDAKNNQAWVPDGFGDHFVLDGADYVAMLMPSGREVQLSQFGAIGHGDETLNIKAAIDYFDNKCEIKGDSNTFYSLSSGIAINGASKELNLLGGSFVFTLSGGVAITLGDSNTENEAIGLSNANVSFANSSGNIIAIQAVGKNMRMLTKSVAVFGGGSAAGNRITGMQILGGKDKTPFFSTHTNIRVNNCAVGIELFGAIDNDSSYTVTTQTFIQPTLTLCYDAGIRMRNTGSNTFIAPSVEYCNIGIDQCNSSRDYFFGGLNEGCTTPTNIENRSSTSNFLMSPSIFSPLDGNDWKVLPDIYTNERLVLVKSVMPLFTIPTGATVNIGKIQRGKLTVQNRRGTWAEILITTTGDSTTPRSAILNQDFNDGAFSYTLVKDTPNRINIYLDNGDYFIQNNSPASSVTSLSYQGE